MKLDTTYSDTIYRERRIGINPHSRADSEITGIHKYDSFLQDIKDPVIDQRSIDTLSGNERATLHMLFGSEKPDELTFYGKNRVKQIHKGQLIDLVA